MLKIIRYLDHGHGHITQIFWSILLYKIGEHLDRKSVFIQETEVAAYKSLTNWTV